MIVLSGCSALSRGQQTLIVSPPSTSQGLMCPFPKYMPSDAMKSVCPIPVPITSLVSNHSLLVPRPFIQKG